MSPPETPFPWIAVGDRATFILITGTPMTGEVLDIELNSDGDLAGVQLKSAVGDMEALNIAGRMIGFWHKGDPPAALRLLGGLQAAAQQAVQPAQPYGRG
jgi:hypothetical protein